MIESADNLQKAKSNLREEITSLKKQSFFSLLMALLFIATTAYMFFRLQDSNLELKEKRDSLVVLTKALNEFRVKELERSQLPIKLNEIQIKQSKFRIEQMELNKLRSAPMGRGYAPPDTSGVSAPPLPNKRRIAGQRSKPKNITGQTFRGYLIYIQDKSGGRVADALQTYLREREAIVPDIQRTKLPKSFGDSVKYFHKQDKGTAAAIGQQLLVLLKKSPDYAAGDIPIIYVKNPKVPLGQLEVWIGGQ